MKRTAIYVLLVCAFMACKNKSNTSGSVEGKDSVSTASTIEADQSKGAADTTFDIQSIPVTDKDPGTFPYLNPPETYTYGFDKQIRQSDIKDFDKEYFAVNGKLIPQEGKSYKVSIEKDRSDGKRFNSLIVERSYEQAILALGGVKVNHVPVSNEEYKRVGDKELIEKHYGASINANLLDDIKTYVIRTKDKVIWIQMSLLNEESGNLTVLETGELKIVNKISNTTNPK
ncbi:hypothetical protein [Pedobacter metabolipauper]|uniref:Lipoprotein n=1 Tax=Pedobacter metabolipauper TaxID=425513 RepID=A0A4R6T076_9SPHI|nr:hypothetical protein [Pedobacter metabolipauper]TDQ11792.1 hypothetical protein ATK78_0920 [Pedobacter metabolipauper]